MADKVAFIKINELINNDEFFVYLNQLGEVEEILISDKMITSVNNIPSSKAVIDGHSFLITDDAMFGGGQIGTNLFTQTCDMKQFSSSANAIAHGSLSEARGYLTAGSDGSQAMFGGGKIYTTSAAYVNTCEMKQFSNTSTAVAHGNLIQAKIQTAAGSDGVQVMFGGGWDNNPIVDCDMKQFSSTANAVDHGDLSQARYALAAGSDGTQVMFISGWAVGLINTCDIKQFASTAEAADLGDLSVSRYFVAAASDGTQVMIGGGWNSASLSSCDLKQFSSSSVSIGHGDLTSPILAPAAVSDGTQVMFCGGSNSSAFKKCDLKQFSSDAIAINNGELTEARTGLAGSSGRA